MNNKRLQDQVLILAAIRQVKQQLAKSMKDELEDNNWMRTGEILIRLTTLYSCLDIDRLTRIVLATDTRKENKAA